MRSMMMVIQILELLREKVVAQNLRKDPEISIKDFFKKYYRSKGSNNLFIRNAAKIVDQILTTFLYKMMLRI